MSNCARPGFAVPCGTCDACLAHKPRAYATEGYAVSLDWTDPEEKHRWFHLKLDAPFDYEQVKKLPEVLAYDGDTFVRTGWNSDCGEVYYRNGMKFATGVK